MMTQREREGTSGQCFNGENGEWGNSKNYFTPCFAGWGWSSVGTQHGTNSWPRSPTGDSSLHLPCHKTHFLLVLGITRCDAGTKDNTDSGDEEPVICFDASIQPTEMRQHLDTRGACNRQDTLIYKMSGLIFQS